MKRIYIDARNITAAPTGVGRYAEFVIPELVALGRGRATWVVLRHDSNRDPMPWTGDADVTEAYLSEKIGSITDFFTGSRALERVVAQYGAPDLFHTLMQIAPLGIETLATPAPRLVTTLQDVIWIDHPIASQGSLGEAFVTNVFARIAIASTVARSTRVICTSSATKRAAERHFGPFPTTHVPLGVHDRYFGAYDAPSGEVGSLVERDIPYFVAVGNAKRYKNIHTLVRAFKRSSVLRSRARLVLVGPPTPFHELLRAEGISDGIIVSGFLDEDEFIRTLSHATAFVFPSLVEGFGLPPLEAMALGVPTLIADVEPMRSTCGEGARAFSPRDANALARELERIMHSGALRQAMSERARSHAANYRWRDVARDTFAVYEDVLGMPATQW